MPTTATTATGDKPLSASFPTETWSPRLGARPSSQEVRRHRENLATHFLSTRGAMEPEGCSAETLERAAEAQRLEPGTVKQICHRLREARLLGWSPEDVQTMEFVRVLTIAREGIRR